MLCGIDVGTIEDAKNACKMLRHSGPCSVIVKGGHLESSKGTDVFYDGNEFHVLASPTLDVEVRGTGCVYSSLIAGYMAKGLDNLNAVKNAKSEMDSALRHSGAIGDRRLAFGEKGNADRRGCS